jgi:PPOX class probable FMN-dependent enzyme
MDPFAAALTSQEQLDALYQPAEERSWRKDVGLLDEMCRRLIAATPMVFVATAAQDGRLDVSPRGGPPGFVTVLDEHHLAIPDATGNRRLDSLRNVVATGRAGLIFVTPGRTETLRVNGRACISADAELLERLSPVGKPPRTAIVVEADEVYAHCPKAFVRSKLWDPASWPAKGNLPSPAEVTLAHLRDPALTLAEVEQRQRDALKYRLA